MYTSEFSRLLCGPVLPVAGYQYSTHSIEQREAVLDALFAKPGIAVSEGPGLSTVEIESEGAIYLVTRPGHFAHPSLLRRALVTVDGVRTVEVTGWSAADPEVMATWMDQFRTQDAYQRGRMGG